jgi:hypothetical protein
MEDTRSRWPGIVAVLAVFVALAAFVLTRGDVASGAQNPPAATQSAPPQGRHDCPEHDGGAPQEQQAPSTQSTPGTEL